MDDTFVEDSFRKARERSARINRVIAERKLILKFKTDLTCNLMYLQGSLSPEDMRALANAIDGVDDWKDALLKDLKEENAAYQRGLEDGKKIGVDELLACFQDGQMFLKEGDNFVLISKESMRRHCHDDSPK